MYFVSACFCVFFACVCEFVLYTVHVPVMKKLVFLSLESNSNHLNIVDPRLDSTKCLLKIYY